MKNKLRECRKEYISNRIIYNSFEDVENITREIDNFISYCDKDVKDIEGLFKCKHNYISELRDDKQMECSRIIDGFIHYFETQYMQKNDIHSIEVKNGKDILEFNSLNYGEMVDMLADIEKSNNEHSKIIQGLMETLINLSYHLKKLNKKKVNVSQAKEYFRKQSPEDILILYRNIMNISNKEFLSIYKINSLYVDDEDKTHKTDCKFNII
jgi:hypothetical protein